MRNIPDKNPGDQLLSAEYTDHKNELQGIVTDTGQTLSSGDGRQLSKASANYSSGGDFYHDSGSANAYVLSSLGNYQRITTLRNGMHFRFRASHSNTSAATANVGTTGALSIKNRNGSALTEGEIVAGDESEISYNSSSGGHYTLISRNDAATNIPFAVGTLVAVSPTLDVYEFDLNNTYTSFTNAIFFRARFATSNTKPVGIKFTNSTAYEPLRDPRHISADFGVGELGTEKDYLISYLGAPYGVFIYTADDSLEESLLKNYMGITTGTAAAVILNPSRRVSLLRDGYEILADAHVTVAAGAALNFCDTGLKDIKVKTTSGHVSIEADTWRINHRMKLHYDGPNGWWVIDSPLPLSSTPEITARLITTKGISPSGLETQQATTTLKGIAKRVTTAKVQVIPAVDDVDMMTALKAQEFYDERKASAAVVKTGTDVNRFAPVSEIKAHRGVAKAWVNFDSIPVTLVERQKYNVSSVTDNGAGIFRINFITSFLNTSYVAAGMADGGAGGRENFVGSLAFDETYHDLNVTNLSANREDATYITAVYFGD